MRLFRLLLIFVALIPPALAQPVPASRDLELRVRYEQVLERSPFQEQAFDRVFQSYSLYEGIDAWRRALEQAQTSADSPIPYLVLRARIAARLLDTPTAIALLEQAQAGGATGPEFAVLLGRLYHDSGRDAEAITVLEAALEDPRTPEERGRIIRLLGNLFLRLGDRDAAIAAWERLAEGTQADAFAIEELAMLYETQRMWPEAAEAWRRVAAQAERDPYLRCRALQALGDAEKERGEHRAAAAAYREALDWVAPGTWLFEALTQRLVDTHAAMHDLPGLARSLEQWLQSDPAQTELRVLLGDVRMRLADWDEAEAAYREAIRRAPAQQTGYAALIRFHEARGELEAIAEAYQAAIQRFPGEPDYRFRLGEAYLRAGKRDEALAVWRAGLGPQPDAQDHARLARWLEARAFRMEARTAYADALAHAPNREWELRLATLEYDTGDRQAARARWLRLGEDEHRPDALLEVAGLLAVHGFQQEALEVLARAASGEPGRLDITLARADLLLAIQSFDEAEGLYGRLAEQTESDFHRERGERGYLDVLDAQGRLADIRSQWERDAAADRSNVLLRMRLARLCERMGDRGRALALYRECATIEPDNPALLHQLARIYEATGHRGESIKTYRRLIEVDPGRAGGYYRDLIPILTQQNDQAGAIEAAQRVVELAPANPEARIALGQVYDRFSQPQGMLEAFREAVRLAPDEPAYHETLGQALLANDAHAEAREAFRAMLDASRNAAVRLRAAQHLAVVHARLDRTEELVREFEARVQESPREVETYELLAAVHRASGMPQAALSVLERAAVVADDRETALRRVLVEAHSAGQLETVVRAYEQLEAMGADLAPREWEQLGRSYAQLGRLPEAERAWERMVEGAHGQDPSILRAYARVVQEHGFEDAAFEATARLLTIEHYDFTTRLQFAQQLAASDRLDEAMEQLRTLLRLGEGPSDEGDEAQAVTADPAIRIPPHLAQSAVHFSSQITMQAMMGMGLAPGGGAYPAARQQALHLLGQLAHRAGDADALVEEYAARVTGQPESLRSHFDLVLVLQTLNRGEELLAHARGLLEAFPEHIDALRFTAQLFEAHRQYDEALAAYERLHDAEIANDTVRRGTRIRLLMAAGRTEQARAEVTALREAFPNHPGVLRQVAGQLVALNDFEQAEELYRALAQADPRHRQTAFQELAHQYRNRGFPEKAAAIYGELLFVPPPPGQAQTIPQPGFPNPYLPQPQGMGGGTHAVENVVRQLTQRFDWPRLEAFQQSVTIGLDPSMTEALLDEMRTYARSAEQRPAEEQLVAFELATLLAAYAIERGEAEEALAWQEDLERLGAPPTMLTNLRLLALDVAQDLEALHEAYGELAEAYPQQAPDFRLAQARLAAQRTEWDTMAAILAELVEGQRLPRETLALIRNLHEAGQFDHAEALVDAHLALPNPIPDAYGLRIQVLSAQGRHDEAMRLARDSWEYVLGQERLTGAARAGRVRTARDLQGSAMAQLMVSVYQAAGRADDALAHLERRAAEEPGIQQAQLDLAHAYLTLARVDDAFGVYRGMVERRPGDTTLRMAYAQLLTEQQRDREAYAIFEDILRANPALYGNLAWQIRQLYERLGKSTELAAIERRIAMATTDPRAMHQMAQQALNFGNLDLAVSLFERLARMAPGEDSYRLQLADAQQRAGRLEASLETWRGLLVSLGMQPERTTIAVIQAAPVFDHAGERAYLEQLAAERLAADPGDALGLLLIGGLAQYEGHLAEAIEHYERLLAVRPQDAALLGLVVDLARVSGDHERVIALLEDRTQTQGHARWAELGDIYALQGDRERAFEYWQRDAARHTGPVGIEQMMRRLVEHGMHDEAVGHFEKHAARARATRQSHNVLAQHLLRSFVLGGTTPEPLIRTILREHSTDSGTALGNILQGGDGSRERRRQLLAWALEERPGDANMVRLALSHMQQGNHDEHALAIVRRLVEQHPESSDAQVNLIQVLVSLNRIEEARAFVEDQLDARVSTALLNQALRLYQQEQDHAAILELRTRHWPALEEVEQRHLDAQWAYAFAVAGDAEGAIASLQRQHEADPTQSHLDRYHDMLWRSLDGRAAYAAFEAARAEGAWRREGHIPAPAINLLMASNRIDEVIAMLWERAEEGPLNAASVQVRSALTTLQASGYARPFLEAWQERLAAAEPLTPAQALVSIDAATQAQMGALLNASLTLAIARHPTHPEFLQRHAQALHAAGRLAESAAALEAAIEHSPSSRREAIRRTLLEAYAALDDQAGLERLLFQTLRPLPTQGQEFSLNAQYLTRAGRYGAAAEAWRIPASMPNATAHTHGEYAAALARTGRIEDALALFEDAANPPEAQGTLHALAEAAEVDASMRLLRLLDGAERTTRGQLTTLMHAALTTRTLDEAEAVLTEMRAQPAYAQAANQFAQDTVPVMLRVLEPDAIMDLLARLDHAALWMHAAEPIALTAIEEGNSAAASQRIAVLGAALAENPEGMYRAYDALMRHDAAALGSALLAHYTLPMNATVKEDLALARAALEHDTPTAQALFSRAFAREPATLLAYPDGAGAIAAHAPGQDMAAWLEAAAPEAAHPERAALVEAALAAGRGDIEAAREYLEGITRLERLETEALGAFGLWLAQNGQHDLLLALCRRVVEGRVQREARVRLLQFAFETAVTVGDMDAAIEMLDALAWTGAPLPWGVIERAASKWPGDQHAEGLARMAALRAGYLGSPGATGLALFEALLSTGGSTNAPIDGISEAWRLVSWQRDLVAICTWAPRDWWVSPRHRVNLPASLEAAPTGIAQAVLQPDAPLESAEGWVRRSPIFSDPARLPGTFTPLYGVRAEQHAVYLATDIHSPDARTVPFTASGDDWLRVWINGEEVLRDEHAGPVVAGEHRFEAALQAGSNRIVMWLGNGQGPLAVSFSVLGNAEGMVFGTDPS